jgi:hypothetical protein
MKRYICDLKHHDNDSWTLEEGAYSWYGKTFTDRVLALPKREEFKCWRCRDDFTIRHVRVSILLFKLGIEPR